MIIYRSDDFQFPYFELNRFRRGFPLTSIATYSIKLTQNPDSVRFAVPFLHVMGSLIMHFSAIETTYNAHSYTINLWKSRRISTSVVPSRCRQELRMILHSIKCESFGRRRRRLNWPLEARFSTFPVHSLLQSGDKTHPT